MTLSMSHACHSVDDLRHHDICQIGAQGTEAATTHEPPLSCTQPSKEMNAVVAHTRDGIEVVEVATGRPICSMVLAARQMHADVNMDGVLDHIW